MSDLDMSEHTEALWRLCRSLEREPAVWSDDELADVQTLAKEIAGTAETIRLRRALGGQWRLSFLGLLDEQTFGSKIAVYGCVRELARLHATGDRQPQVARVWVDEGHGRGWELYETLDLHELATTPQPRGTS